jgi:hypothetical protein
MGGDEVGPKRVPTAPNSSNVPVIRVRVERLSVAEDDVVQEPDANHATGVADLICRGAIRFAGFSPSGWMVMGDDKRSRAEHKRGLQDFPGMNKASVGNSRKPREPDCRMSSIKVQGEKMLARIVEQHFPQQSGCVFRL